MEVTGDLTIKAPLSEPTKLENLFRVIEEKVGKEEVQNFDSDSKKKQSSS